MNKTRPGSKAARKALLAGALFSSLLLFAGCGTDFDLGLWTAEEGGDTSATATSYGRDFLDAVTGVAVDGDFLYVTDPFTDLVIKLDMTKSGADEFVWEKGGTGTGDFQLTDPAGIAIDGSGDVYVADSGNGRVQKLSSDGEFLLKIGEAELDTPVGIAIDGQGYIYVADEALHKVFKYSGVGAMIDEFGSGPGGGQGELSAPTAVAVDFDGNVFVMNTGNFRIEVYTTEGEFVRNFGGYGTSDGMFRNPYGVAVDTYRHVLAGDLNLDKIQRFEQNGVFLNSFSTAKPDGALLDPKGLAVQGDFVYIAESGAHRIRKAPFSLFSK